MGIASPRRAAKPRSTRAVASTKLMATARKTRFCKLPPQLHKWGQSTVSLYMVRQARCAPGAAPQTRPAFVNGTNAGGANAQTAASAIRLARLQRLVHNKPKYGSELAAQCFAVAWQTANCCGVANKAGRRRRQLPAFLAGAGAPPANGSGCCAPAPPAKKVSRETRRWYAGGRAIFCSTAPRKYICDRALFQRTATPAFVYLAQACVSRETFARARHGRGYAVRSATSSSSPVRGSVPDFMATSSCARRA